MITILIVAVIIGGLLTALFYTAANHKSNRK